jgi:ankyrin repeat protein
MLIEKGANVNANLGSARRGFDCRTALHWAAGNGLVKMVEALLLAKADVNAEDSVSC